MMDLEKASKLVIRETMRWIKENEHRPGWMLTNFPGCFLYNCQILRQTAQFREHWNRSVLKVKYLSYNFDGKELKHVGFMSRTSYGPTLGVEQLNTYLKEALHNPTYWEKEEWKPETQVVPGVVGYHIPTLEAFGNSLKKLENFQFVNQ